MENNRFKVVFEKLCSDVSFGAAGSRELIEIREVAVEADELAELRQLVADTREPELQFLTLT